MAAGHFASENDRNDVDAIFRSRGWMLFDPDWILRKIQEAVNSSFENDVAHVVAKLIVRNSGPMISP